MSDEDLGIDFDDPAFGLASVEADAVPEAPEEFHAHPKQVEFFDLVMSGKYRSLLFGGAIGGGKTVNLIMLFSLFARMWPGSRWALTRKDLPSLRKATIPSFEQCRKWTGSFWGQIRHDTWSVKAENGSELLFWPASEKEDPELNRWKGLEVNGFGFEEANEMSFAAYLKALQRAGRWKIKGKHQPPPLWIGTCNPNRSWPKTLFYDRWKRGLLKAPFAYLPALITDNPSLSAEYLENLKVSMPDRDYQRDVLGNWDLADEPNQLILSDWVLQAFDRPPVTLGEQRMGVDVARYGDDESVIARTQGKHLVFLEAYAQKSVDQMVDITAHAIRSSGTKAYNVRVDAIGLGAGVCDYLRKQHLRVTEFVAGASPIEKKRKIGRGKQVTEVYTYKNLRSQVWWQLREKLRKGEVSFKSELRNVSKLIEDLTAPKYLINDRVIEVESKDDIKKRTGRSTDYGDAVVQAYADLKDNHLDLLAGSW